MNVYPVNAVEAFSLNSPQRESYSLLTDLYNRYISYQADFSATDIELTGSCDNATDIDTIILGNTNAQSGRIKLYDHDVLIHEADFETSGYLTIINTEKKKITRFIIDLSGNENIKIGYLFTGMKWELPRFVIQPVNGLILRNESDRTFTGQVTGGPVETLKTFNASYMRIENDQKKKFDDYINGVQTVIPHVIDPYPEAHEQFEPFFATVESYGEAVKREENNFYWNMQCGWKEAK